MLQDGPWNKMPKTVRQSHPAASNLLEEMIGQPQVFDSNALLDFQAGASGQHSLLALVGQ